MLVISPTCLAEWSGLVRVTLVPPKTPMTIAPIENPRYGARLPEAFDSLSGSDWSRYATKSSLSFLRLRPAFAPPLPGTPDTKMCTWASDSVRPIRESLAGDGITCSALTDGPHPKLAAVKKGVNHSARAVRVMCYSC